jgi:hypothetical protein
MNAAPQMILFGARGSLPLSEWAGSVGRLFRPKWETGP